MKNFLGGFLILMVTISWPATASAGKAAERARRGVVNILTAPVEIPKQFRAYWIEGSQKTSHIIVWLICGTVKGVVNTVKRESSGIFDLLTAGCPYFKDQEPMAKPDYVFQNWPTRKDSTVIFTISSKIR